MVGWHSIVFVSVVDELQILQSKNYFSFQNFLSQIFLSLQLDLKCLRLFLAET